MDEYKIRVGGLGTPPYNGTVKDFSSTNLGSITGVMDDEFPVSDAMINAAVGGIEVSITDALGKKGKFRVDKGTLRCQKRLMIGFSSANGNTENHIQAINDGDEMGLSFTGVMFETQSIETDAQLAALTALGPFDATVPISGSPVFFFDSTVRQARSKSTCNMIRINIWLKRQLSLANNGTTRTQFIGLEDSQMRPGGTIPIIRPEGNSITDTIYPSLASPNTLAYAKKLSLPLLKRYVQSLNDGTIIGIGTVLTSNGESEIDSTYKVGGTEEEVRGGSRTQGDFHQASRAKFNARFPEYTSKTDDEIYDAAYNSDLKIKWRLHNNLLVKEFEHAMFTFWQQNVPGLTRVRAGQQDSGSYTDELAFFRCTLNSFERIHPFSFLFKPNDNSEEPDDTLNFFTDHGTSMARLCGGIFIAEPSPTFPYNDHLASVVHEMQILNSKGGGTSFYTTSRSIAEGLMSASGLTAGGIPLNKQEFKTIGGHKRLVRHSVNISDVLRDGGYGGSQFWRNSHRDFRSAQGLTHVDTRSVQNISANPAS